MQLLFKSAEILHGLVCFATLTQKVMELVHGMGISGQEVTVLQCLHRGFPLAQVVRVITPLFQSGDGPSRGPRRLRGRTEQWLQVYISICDLHPNNISGSVREG